MTTITKLKKSISEQSMVDSFLKSSHFRTSLLYTEVPVFSRCVDVVVLNNKNQISAIEFKREKWREAIDQVMRVATSFDYLEICVFKPQQEELRKDILNTCSFMGIGVYFINPTNMKVSKVLKPQKNRTVWKIQKKSVINYLGDKHP